MSSISLPIIFQDHMMLQHGKPIEINGTCSKGNSLTIVLDNMKKCVPIHNGAFHCILDAPRPGYHKELTFYIDTENTPELSITDINIGDLWLAAGQSNMEYFLRYDAHWNDVKKLPKNENIRMFNMPQIAFEGQERNLPDSGFWFEEGNAAWAVFSAPGYAFARYIQPHLNIPVGIIGCNWGGTPACAWMDEAYLSKEPLHIFQTEYEAAIANISEEALREDSLNAWVFEDSYRHQLEWRTMMYGLTHEEQLLWMEEHKEDPVLPMGPYHHYRPSGLYHTMLKKLAPFSIKGILWYQGESDSGHADIYDVTMNALIQCFRDLFNDKELPFLFAQLAPFGIWLDCTGENYEIVREKQDIVSNTVKNTGMISLMDLGMYEDIHPKYKMEVGERFALLARGKVYGEDLLCESPEIANVSVEKNTILLTFRNTGTSLKADETCKHEFEIICKGTSYSIKKCEICGDHIKLSFDLPDDTFEHEMLEVSYAYKPYCKGTIFNQAGLPLKPFHLQLSVNS